MTMFSLIFSLLLVVELFDNSMLIAVNAQYVQVTGKFTGTAYVGASLIGRSVCSFIMFMQFIFVCI